MEMTTEQTAQFLAELNGTDSFHEEQHLYNRQQEEDDDLDDEW